jgi:Outer membrane protein beta-barrel domain
MKNLMQTVLVTGMMFLYTFSFGQIQGSGSPIIKDATTAQESYVHFFVNAIGTNLYYGDANKGLADYKKAALGVTIGASYQAGICHNLSLVSELYFIMKGGKLNENNPLTDHESTLRMYSFELPVMARIHLGQFHVEAGPSLAYNVHGTQKIDGLTTDLSFGDGAGSYERFETGVQVGAGYSFMVKQKKVYLDIRYCHGLTNISNDTEMYNRCVLVSIHFAKK